MSSDNKKPENEDLIKSVLSDFYESQKNKSNNSDHLEAAMFLEDSFSIILDDDEISPEVLDDPEEAFKLVVKKHQDGNK